MPWPILCGLAMSFEDVVLVLIIVPGLGVLIRGFLVAVAIPPFALVSLGSVC